MSRVRRAARGGVALGALVISFAIVACAPTVSGAVAPAAAQKQVPIYPDVAVTENVAYGPETTQLLDVCQPADAEFSSLNNGPRRAILSVHAGSWREGDKAGPHWRSACEWLASEGFVAFSVNYRLAPLAPFPAGIADVRTVVEWLRQPAQVTAYDFDPALIGAFGGSAGGNLVALLGAEGTGPLDVGTRVAAVVELSGPIDLTADDLLLGEYTAEFQRHQLEYLGCEDYASCTTARSASPVYAVDPSDPPFFIGHSTDEFTPIGQADALVSALETAGVDSTFVEVTGKLHSLALLDDAMRAQVVKFLRESL